MISVDDANLRWEKNCLSVADITAAETKNLIGWFLFEHMVFLKHKVLLFMPTSSDQTVIF